MSAKKSKAKHDILIKAFVQKVCSDTSTGKRFVGIRKFLASNGDWNREQCAQIWKGLFYAIWYTEMNKGGEQMIAEIADRCNSSKLLVAGFAALAREWSGIDYLRIDKFARLVRLLMRKAIDMQINAIVNKCKLKLFPQIMRQISDTCGLMYHFTEIFLEEFKSALKQRSLESSTKAEIIITHLTPFANVTATSKDCRTLDTIYESIFSNLKNELLKKETNEMKIVVFEEFINKLSDLSGCQEIRGKNRAAINKIITKMRQFISICDDKKEIDVYSQKVAKRKLKSIEITSKKMKSDLSTKRVFKLSRVPIAED